MALMYFFIGAENSKINNAIEHIKKLGDRLTQFKLVYGEYDLVGRVKGNEKEIEEMTEHLKKTPDVQRMKRVFVADITRETDGPLNPIYE